MVLSGCSWVLARARERYVYLVIYTGNVYTCLYSAFITRYGPSYNTVPIIVSRVVVVVVRMHMTLYYLTLSQGKMALGSTAASRKDDIFC